MGYAIIKRNPFSFSINIAPNPTFQSCDAFFERARYMLAELGFVIFIALMGLGLIRQYHSRTWSFLRLTLLDIAGISALASTAICLNQEGPWENIALNNSGGGRGAVLGLVVIAFSKLGPIFTGLILLEFGLYLMLAAHLRWTKLKTPRTQDSR